MSSNTQIDWPEFPVLNASAAYVEERLLLRAKAETVKAWHAFRMEEYPTAASLLRKALSASFEFSSAKEEPSTEQLRINSWIADHLIEAQEKYLPLPRNGDWQNRSLIRGVSGEAPTELKDILRHEQYAGFAGVQGSEQEALNLLHLMLKRTAWGSSRLWEIYHRFHPLVEPESQMILAPIQPGEFMMGSSDSDDVAAKDEKPQHRVILTKPFWMGIYPVTQSQYRAVTGDSPSKFDGDDLPVEQVSWEDAVSFCAKLNERLGDQLPEGYEYRLPAEAEWEYCCRAGTTTRTSYGDDLGSEQANFHGEYPLGKAEKGRYLEKTSDVGSYAANPWGLFDMHGNVREWCVDEVSVDDDFVVSAEHFVDGIEDPIATGGPQRVNRGGSWYGNGRNCRSAYRRAREPGNRNGSLGFRVCLACVQTSQDD